MNVLRTGNGETGKACHRSSGEVATFSSQGDEYRLECLTSLEDLAHLKSDWQRLERTAQEPFTYFQSFDWCYQWCQRKLPEDHSNRSTELRVFVLRRDEVVVMIWPMMEAMSRSRARILTFLTDPLAQYANVIADRTRVNEKTGCKVWKLIRKHSKVDAVTINSYPNGSFLDSILCGVGFAEQSQMEASILDLTGFDTWEEHYANLSKNQRKQRRRRRAKLEKDGEVTLEVGIGGSAIYKEHVRHALKMKQEWMENTGRKPGILSETETEDFLSNLKGNATGEGDCPEGAVTLALCVDGVPVAIEIGMVMNRHYYSYLGAFDWAWRTYSPGKVQIEAAQVWAKSVGLEKFDFLGDPSDYKEEWTCNIHPLSSRSVPITVLGLIYCAVWKSQLRPRLKELYKNMASDRRRIFSKITEVPGRLFGSRAGA